MNNSLIQRTIWAAAVLCSAGTALAQAPSNRLALVIGEGSYVDHRLQTIDGDSTLVAQSLRAQGFDVTELHNLNTVDLADDYNSFIVKAANAPAGAIITAYLAGLAVQHNCDDILLPIDARITQPADAARIGLSMARIMSDLSRNRAQARLVLLDGARPIPASVSSVNFGPGLGPLAVPAATSFGLSAEIHDFTAPDQPESVNGPYAQAFAKVSAQPSGDFETFLRDLRFETHQASGGAQTPWESIGSQMPPGTILANVDPQQIQAAAAGLPNGTDSLSGMSPDSAYWAAIWRNSVEGYRAYLTSFGASASPVLVARVKTLLTLLEQATPQCSAGSSSPILSPPPLPAPPLAPQLVEQFVGACPPGFIPDRGFDESRCAPVSQPRLPACPRDFALVFEEDLAVCEPRHRLPRLVCPPDFHPANNGQFCAPNEPPPRWCPPGFAPLFQNGGLFCRKNGPPVPGCSGSAHAHWTGATWICEPNPPPPLACGPSRFAVWNGGRWNCLQRENQNLEPRPSHPNPNLPLPPGQPNVSPNLPDSPDQLRQHQRPQIQQRQEQLHEQEWRNQEQQRLQHQQEQQLQNQRGQPESLQRQRPQQQNDQRQPEQERQNQQRQQEPQQRQRQQQQQNDQRQPEQQLQNEHRQQEQQQRQRQQQQQNDQRQPEQQLQDEHRQQEQQQRQRQQQERTTEDSKTSSSSCDSNSRTSSAQPCSVSRSGRRTSNTRRSSCRTNVTPFVVNHPDSHARIKLAGPLRSKTCAPCAASSSVR